MFRAQNFSSSNKTVSCSPSQGNSCTVNDWDTWFYSAYVVASELPAELHPVGYCVRNVLQERVYYCTKVDNVVDLKQRIVAERAALDHSIIASAIAQWRLRLHMLVFALPVNILSIVCSDIMHSSCNKYWLTPVCCIFVKFIRLSLALSKNYDSLDKFLGNLEYF